MIYIHRTLSEQTLYFAVRKSLVCKTSHRGDVPTRQNGELLPDLVSDLLPLYIMRRVETRGYMNTWLRRPFCSTGNESHRILERRVSSFYQ